VLLDSHETKEKILAEFLKICALEGWTQSAISQAVSNTGISEKFSDVIFENGVLEIAEFYVESQNKKLSKKIHEIENFHSQKIRDKIRLTLYARVELEKDNQIALQRLINFYLDLRNFTSFEVGAKPMIQGMRACFKISDLIWKEINDQSTDFNFYTKRLTLAKIILRTLFVFVKDDSQNFIKTKNFIDSQIAKVMKFEKYKMQAKKIVSTVFLNEEGVLKTPKEIIKNLPFFRLIKS
jgi:ubiquinone biosynthesis protein COQ9